MSRHAHTPRPLTTIHDLTLDARNANRGTPRGQALLADSLTTFGAGRSIVADRHGCVVAGNKTVAQAQAIDLPIHVVETTGDALVVVQRTDLDLTAGGPARQLALADNRIGQLDLEWDATLLAQFQAEGVPFRDLWTPAELEPLFGHGLHPGLIRRTPSCRSHRRASSRAISSSSGRTASCAATPRSRRRSASSCRTRGRSS